MPLLLHAKRPTVNHLNPSELNGAAGPQAQTAKDPAMNEDDKSILKQSKKVHDESQSLRDNAKIITGESAGAVEQARQAIIKLRLRRRKRTVIIK